jgi:tRNA nucleotidyltransferase (CCA-adding enzyme)
MTVWQIVTMDRDQILAKLREYAGELKAAGVEHLFLHGSYARGTATLGSSDVDVIGVLPAGVCNLGPGQVGAGAGASLASIWE